MRILFTICGRAGSKGLKNKNLKEFLGFPLAFYTASAIDIYTTEHPEVKCDVALNTDSQELVELFLKVTGMHIDIIKTEEELSGDDVSKISVIRKTYEVMCLRKQYDYDMVVDLDITSPLRQPQDLERLIEKAYNSAGIDVVFSVTDARRNPYFNMVMKSEEGYYTRILESSFTARQQAPEIFDMNASMYAYNPNFLMRRMEIFEGRCSVIKMQDTAVLDIDNEHDFELMEVVAQYIFSQQKEFSVVRDNIRILIR